MTIIFHFFLENKNGALVFTYLASLDYFFTFFFRKKASLGFGRIFFISFLTKKISSLGFGSPLKIFRFTSVHQFIHLILLRILSFFLGINFVWGGEMKAHAKAQEDSWHSIKEFLKSTLVPDRYKQFRTMCISSQL